MASMPLVGLPTDRKEIGPHPFLAVGEKYVRAVVDGFAYLRPYGPYSVTENLEVPDVVEVSAVRGDGW